MILWTIQTAEWYEEFRRSGEMTGAWEYVDRDWLPAYQWMSAEMNKRIHGRQRSSAPIWSWYQYRASRPRPDLRCRWHLPCGSKGVRIEFHADPGEVLLSDFQKWHAILNRSFLARSEQESIQWDIHSKHLGTQERQARIEDSWTRIFDVSFDIRDDYWNGPDGPQVQGCLWSLKQSEIFRVKHFTAR